MFDLEGYFPLQFSYSVVRASVHGNLSKFPTRQRLIYDDLCRDDFLALCCRRSLKSSMIRERHENIMG